MSPEIKKEEELAAKAYKRGYETYENTEIARKTDSIQELDPMIEIPVTDSAHWANTVSPWLRRLAGNLDAGHGTYQVRREITLKTRDGGCIETDSRTLYDRVFETYRRGCYHAIEGREKDSGGMLD